MNEENKFNMKNIIIKFTLIVILSFSILMTIVDMLLHLMRITINPVFLNLIIYNITVFITVIGLVNEKIVNQYKSYRLKKGLLITNAIIVLLFIPHLLILVETILIKIVIILISSLILILFMNYVKDNY